MNTFFLDLWFLPRWISRLAIPLFQSAVSQSAFLTMRPGSNRFWAPDPVALSWKESPRPDLLSPLQICFFPQVPCNSLLVIHLVLVPVAFLQPTPFPFCEGAIFIYVILCRTSLPLKRSLFFSPPLVYVSCFPTHSPREDRLPSRDCLLA